MRASAAALLPPAAGALPLAALRGWKCSKPAHSVRVDRVLCREG